MNERPPLWTWAASFALAITIVAGMLGWTNSRISAPQAQHNPAYLHLERLKAVNNETLIAFVGTSLTRCDIAADWPMAYLLHQRGMRARFVRISRNSLALDRTPAIWAPLLKAPPKLLILEANILRFVRAEDPFAFDWRTRIRDQLLSLNPARKADGWETENVAGAAPSCGVTTDAPRTSAEYRDTLNSWRAASPDHTRFIVHQLRALEAQGTSIWILDLPRNPRFEPYFPGQLRTEGNRALRQVLGGTHARMMRNSPRLSVNDFQDAAHLRPSGQTRLSQWLADRIVHRLAEER